MIQLNLSGNLVDKPGEKKGPDTINPAVTELFDNLPVAVYTCDRNGYITSYNRAAAKLWGREPEIGKDLWGGSWKIYRPDGSPYPSETCAMALTLKEGSSVEGDEIIIERQDGSRRNVLPYPMPIFNADGILTGATNTLIDITEQKNSEEK
ncbi:MAG: PAS domain S-box protein, partial [Mucilaginibacter sp.]